MDGIKIADMCQKHQYLLVRQAHYLKNDRWQSLIIASQIALFQAASVDPRIWKECEGKIENFEKCGCLACQKPDAFGEIVEAAKSHDLRRIKELGEGWVYAAAKAEPPSA